jgi:rhamnose transport system substrate-binding protein
MKTFFALLALAAFAIGCKPGAPSTDTSSASSTGTKQLTIAFMPKSKGNAYFIACRTGAEQAAKD